MERAKAFSRLHLNSLRHSSLSAAMIFPGGCVCVCVCVCWGGGHIGMCDPKGYGF